MKREWTNKIRHLLDNYVPARWRNAAWFMRPLFFMAYRGRNVREAMHFKTLVRNWSPTELADYYSRLNSISRNRKTDISQKGVDEIIAIAGPITGRILDAGCGKGYLLSLIRNTNSRAELHGCDIADLGERRQHFRFEQSDLANLPYPDRFFDLVICAHTLEHVIPVFQAVAELKRVCRGKLVIVTPRQKYFYYTLDEHVNFFEKEEDLLSLVSLPQYECRLIDGDWFYTGDNCPV